MADLNPGVSSLSGEDKAVARLGAQIADVTDVGLRRHNNQDNHLVLPLGDNGAAPNRETRTSWRFSKGHLLVAVADGMGGHFGGEVASRLCVENLTKEIGNQIQSADNGQPSLPAALQKAVEATHKAVFAHAQVYAENLTMGTTLTAALLHGDAPSWRRWGTRAPTFSAMET